MENILEKLKETIKKEKRRRAQAIYLLEQITDEISGPLGELLGEEYIDGNEVARGYIWMYCDWLYFRYLEHRERDMREDIGFYVTDNGLPIWGSPLEDVRGEVFWNGIENICEWVENMLPAHIEKHNKCSKDTLSYLKKIAESILEEKE